MRAAFDKSFARAFALFRRRSNIYWRRVEARHFAKMNCESRREIGAWNTIRSVMKIPRACLASIRVRPRSFQKWSSVGVLKNHASRHESEDFSDHFAPRVVARREIERDTAQRAFVVCLSQPQGRRVRGDGSADGVPRDSGDAAVRRRTEGGLSAPCGSIIPLVFESGQDECRTLSGAFQNTLDRCQIGDLETNPSSESRAKLDSRPVVAGRWPRWTAERPSRSLTERSRWCRTAAPHATHTHTHTPIARARVSRTKSRARGTLRVSLSRLESPLCANPTSVSSPFGEK